MSTMSTQSCDCISSNSLLIAARKGHNDCVQSLLAAPGIDVNAADKYATALMWAAWNGRKACIQSLLAASGIDVNATGEDGSTALMLAVIRDHIDCVQLLLFAPGVDVNAVNKYGETALTIAASIGIRSCVKLLARRTSTPRILECIRRVQSSKPFLTRELRWRARWGDAACVRKHGGDDVGFHPPSRAVVSLALLQIPRA